MHHESVLLSESLQWLDLPNRSVIIDATLGLGGHSEAILSSSDFSGRVIGIDQDQAHLDFASSRLSSFSDRFQAVHMNFRHLLSWLSEQDVQCDGILFDLGVASPHFDVAERGFSHQSDGPLDMRMNPEQAKTASDLLDESSFADLVRIFREYGDEKFAVPIAQAVVKTRDAGGISTTLQLSRLIEDVYPTAVKAKLKKHPATKVFQALRIAVNDELSALSEALNGSLKGLSSGGRMLVISYHSLEDRMVKHFFREEADPCVCPPKLPHCACGKTPTLRILTKSAIVPSDDEIAENPRARSARLRVAEKL